jgi:signal transduction histidine kinase/ActR/RegA family two-component response regulator
MTRGRAELRQSLLLCVVAIVSMVAPAFGAEPLAVGSGRNLDAFFEHVEVLEDSTRELDVDDLRSASWSNAFVPKSNTSLSFGYSDSNYWLRFSLRNPEARATEVLLDIGFSQLDEVDLYTPDGEGRFELRRMGDSLPYAQRELTLRGFVFPIEVPPEAERTFYLRVSSSSVVSIPLRLDPTHRYIEKLGDQALSSGVFYGIMIALLVHNLFLYFTSRERLYLYYAGASASYTCYFAQIDGYAYRLLPVPGFWQDFGAFAFIWLGAIFLIQLGRHILETAQHLPRIDAVLKLVLGAIVVAPIFSPFVTPKFYGGYSALLSLTVFTLPTAAYLRMRAGSAPARFYLIAWTPFWLGLALTGVAAVGLLPGFLGFVASLKLVAVGERVMTSFALAVRYNRLQADRLSLQQRLREQEAELAQSRKMEAIGRLAGGVAHDFNNLLTVIHGNAEILAAKETTDTDSRELVDEVLSGADHGAALTRQLLAFGRTASNTGELLDINRLIIGLEPILKRLIGEAYSLDLVLDYDIGRVFADTGEVEQILMNLVLNARDAMPDGGCITVTSDETVMSGDGSTDDRDAAAVACVRVRVSDHGKGMDEQTQANLFEPFFTTKGYVRGTGLGLATVYAIVNRRGGRIRVDSNRANGTEITVLLPRHEIPEVEEPTKREVESAIPHGTETILLVEDESRVLALVHRLLGALGYRVLTANDGFTALEVVEKHADAISLLLTDVVMPGMDGRELWERIHGTHPHIRVLFTSGYPQLPGESTSRVPEGASCLQKPATLAELATHVRTALDAPTPT